jgi:hypothetical protein
MMTQPPQQQLLTTFGGTRRSRRRQAWWGTARVAALGLLVATGAMASYQVGRAQSRAEAVRLEADLAALQELNRLLSERSAAAEQRAEAAVLKTARLQQAYDINVPRGEMRALIELLDQRLRDGVPAERLAFLLREARVQRACEDATESKRLVVHTAAAVVPPASAGFGKDKVTVTAEGAPLRNPDGTTEAAFDPSRPVTLRFLRIGRDVVKVEGALPLGHALVVGDKEYLFAVKAADRPGQIDLVAQACAYP